MNTFVPRVIADHAEDESSLQNQFHGTFLI